MPASGFFIVFEGIDGVGKTTQVKLLKDALEKQGRAVILSREPTDGPWGRRIRESANTGRLSLDDELQAFINDRTEHVRDLILPAIGAGKVVILDRYYYSTIAYQGSRGGDAEQVGAEMRRRFPAPDLVLLMDMDPKQAVHRIAHGRGEQPNEFERLEELERVRAIFLSLDDPNIVVINADQPGEKVHSDIMAAIIQPLREDRAV